MNKQTLWNAGWSGVVIYAVIVSVIWAIPGETLWYEPEPLYISDSTVGEPIEIVTYGEIKRTFYGGYQVISTRIAGGAPKTLCDASSNPFWYNKPIDFKPRPFTLGSWAPQDPRCAALPAGVYSTETCWTILRPVEALLPHKDVVDARSGHTVQRPTWLASWLGQLFKSKRVCSLPKIHRVLPQKEPKI